MWRPSFVTAQRETNSDNFRHISIFRGQPIFVNDDSGSVELALSYLASFSTCDSRGDPVQCIRRVP
mgnify:CR=1 FL=1